MIQLKCSEFNWKLTWFSENFTNLQFLFFFLWVSFVLHFFNFLTTSLYTHTDGHAHVLVVVWCSAYETENINSSVFNLFFFVRYYLFGLCYLLFVFFGVSCCCCWRWLFFGATQRRPRYKWSRRRRRRNNNKGRTRMFNGFSPKTTNQQ